MIDINSIKSKLLFRYPLFGSIVANTNFVEDNTIETACTDSKTIYYNPDFIYKLSDNEKIFIFAHEICHIALNHIFRSEGKDPEIWNIATDAVINAHLKNDGLSFVEGVIDIPDAINHNAEELYEKMLEEKSQNNNSNKNNSNSSNNINSNQPSNNENNQKNNGKVGHHTHELWEKAIEKRKEEKDSNSKEIKSNEKTNNSVNQEQNNETNKNVRNSNFNGNSIKNFFDKLFNKNKIEKKDSITESSKKEETNDKKQEENDLSKEDKEKNINEQIKKISNLGEKKIFNQNKIERKQQLEEIKKSLIKETLGAGRGTNGDLRKIDNIGKSTPLIDWKKLLRDAVTFNVDWSYQNATIEEGVLTPHLEDIPQPVTEIVLDTSGSINNTLLKNFLRECKNILENSKVKVGCFDNVFYGFTEIKNVNDIDNMHFPGGGGTNFNAAVNAFSKRTENKIIFTDGKASMPEMSIDAIWIVFGNKRINPKGGKVIYIDENALNKLRFITTENNISKKR